MGGILVIGSLNMDLVVTTPKVPVMGETILGSGFFTTPGGKGANQAVAAARLGGQVSMIGCVGSDLFGRDHMGNLKVNNVNTDNIAIIDNCSTGVAVIVIKDGDNFIIVDPGANSMLSPEMAGAFEKVISTSDIVILQLEIPLDTVEKVVEIARKHKVKILLNPAPARKLSDHLLSMIDILTPNESECEYITGISINSIEDAKKAAIDLLNRGVVQAVITLGGKGVVYNNGKEIIHKPVPDVKVVDTTAAGDSFSGALAVSLSRGDNIDDAIDFANMVGTLTVTKKGAQASLPTLEDVMKFKSEGNL